MGRMENDPIFLNELEKARAKIPGFFRMTPLKKKVLRILFVGIGVLEILTICLFPRWFGYTVKEVSDFFGRNRQYYASPTGYWKAVFGVAALTIPLLAYMFFSHLFERDAFREANRSAMEVRDRSDVYYSLTNTYVEEQEPEPEEEDPFADAPYAVNKKKPNGIAGGAISAEDPLLTQLREKNLLQEDRGSETDASEAAASKKMPVPVRKNYEQNRFGGDLLSQIVPEKFKEKSVEPLDDLEPVTAENLEEIIAQGPPPPNYISPYATTDLKGVLKSTGMQEPDEIDLFEPDEDIEIFKK